VEQHVEFVLVSYHYANLSKRGGIDIIIIL